MIRGSGLSKLNKKLNEPEAEVDKMYYLENLTRNKKQNHENKLNKAPFALRKKNRLNLLALGDVGGMLLTGLRLLGGDVLSSIGIHDVNPQMAQRFEIEMNQIAYPWDYQNLPEIEIIEKESLFDCDIFVFCASRGVPAVGDQVSDVRMVQFEANRSIITEYARMARDKGFKGLFAVVSDPVDPLCKAAYLESNKNCCGVWDGQGLKADQIQGYGLGVMNSRAAYYAKRDERFRQFLTEGRAFGPHGKDLVLADSIEQYNEKLSVELTELTVNANLQIRELGFKPFIAPALSSGALSLLLTLRGEWHYSSNDLGGVYFGARNRMTESGVEWESLPLPEELFRRIEKAYRNLEAILY